MRVTFIYPDLLETMPGYTGAFYTGVGYLSSVLKKAGHHTELIHIVKEDIEREEFIGRLLKGAPNLIAFSSTTNMFPTVTKLAGWIREEGCGVPVICGGVHPTLSAEEALATHGLDMVCVGEGEEALAELCERLEAGKDYSDIHGIWARVRGQVRRNPVRPLIQDLDSLPFPDREVFDYLNLYLERSGVGIFMASRGCPFSCTYCSNKGLREKSEGKGRYLRFRTPQNIVAEIKEVVGRYPFIKSISFDDNIFFLKRDFAVEFASLYPREVGLPFSCNMHPLYCNREMARLLKQAGCWEVKIGLESGNEEIRKKVLNRDLSQEVMIKAFRACKEEGIKIFSFNMLGLPEETPRTILDTIKLNALVGSDDIQHTIFHPYPGTELYEMCKGKNLMSDRVVTSYYADSILNLGTIRREQILMFHKYFHLLVKVYGFLYRLPWVLSRACIGVLDSVLCSERGPRAMSMGRGLVHPARMVIQSVIGTLKRMVERDGLMQEAGANRKEKLRYP